MNHNLQTRTCCPSWSDKDPLFTQILHHLWVNPYGREGSRKVTERDLTRYQRCECQWRAVTNARLLSLSSVTSLITDFDKEVSLKEMSKDQPYILQVHYVPGVPGESALQSKRTPKNKYKSKVLVVDVYLCHTVYSL